MQKMYSAVIANKFLTNDANMLVNRRMEEEREKRDKYHEIQREKGKSGADKRWHNDMAGAMPVLSPKDKPQDGFSFSSSKKKKDLVIFSLPEDINPDVWKAFVEHRKNLKKPLTEYAKKLILSKLDKIGQDKNAVLNQAIVKGWQDVFPLKDDEPLSSKISFGLSSEAEKRIKEIEERENG
jgi:hypothetical protein